jgi:hypothetical protein
MGWKAGYPALRALGSLVAWRELATAGATICNRYLFCRKNADE